MQTKYICKALPEYLVMCFTVAIILLLLYTFSIKIKKETLLLNMNYACSSIFRLKYRLL